jgi:hypothetical protein
MRQAITTRYLGYTAKREARVKATAAAGSVTLNWDGSLGIDGNHAKAAKALAEKFGWGGRWAAGGLPDGNGNVYVCLEGLDGPSDTFSTVARDV